MLNIFEEQNSEENLMLNYSQRVHYNRAEKLNFINWIVVFLNIILTFFNPKNPQLTNMQTISIFFLSIAELSLVYLVDKNVSIGASTKELLDRNLYSFPIDSKIGSYSENELYNIAIALSKNPKNKEDYQTQITHTGNDTPPGVKDWYTYKPTQNYNSCILNCQQENIYWSNYLSIKHLRVVILALLILLVPIILFSSYFEVSLIKMLPIFGFVLKSKELINGWKYYNSYIQCNAIINCIKNSDIPETKQLMNLQEHIYILRTSKYLIPSILHKIKTKTIHEMWAKAR